MTNRERFDALLKIFLDQDNLALAYPLVGNHMLAAVVHAWSFMNVEIDASSMEVVPTNEKELWNYLWTCSSWDAAELAAASGYSISLAIAYCKRARDLRMIYPDGRISPSVRQFLAIKVVEEMTKGSSSTSDSDDFEDDDFEDDYPHQKHGEWN